MFHVKQLAHSDCYGLFHSFNCSCAAASRLRAACNLLERQCGQLPLLRQERSTRLALLVRRFIMAACPRWHRAIAQCAGASRSEPGVPLAGVAPSLSSRKSVSFFTISFAKATAAL